LPLTEVVGAFVASGLVAQSKGSAVE
jgi:hypothetical protein